MNPTQKQFSLNRAASKKQFPISSVKRRKCFPSATINPKMIAEMSPPRAIKKKDNLVAVHQAECFKIKVEKSNHFEIIGKKCVDRGGKEG